MWPLLKASADQYKLALNSFSSLTSLYNKLCFILNKKYFLNKKIILFNFFMCLKVSHVELWTFIFKVNALHTLISCSNIHIL